jgi:hypothetical protein
VARDGQNPTSKTWWQGIKITSLSTLIVLSPGSLRTRAQGPPSRHRTPRNLKAKRITNRVQTTVAFRLRRKRDTSNP